MRMTNRLTDEQRARVVRSQEAGGRRQNTGVRSQEEGVLTLTLSQGERGQVAGRSPSIPSDSLLLTPDSLPPDSLPKATGRMGVSPLAMGYQQTQAAVKGGCCGR